MSDFLLAHVGLCSIYVFYFKFSFSLRRFFIPNFYFSCWNSLPFIVVSSYQMRSNFKIFFYMSDSLFMTSDFYFKILFFLLKLKLPFIVIWSCQMKSYLKFLVLYIKFPLHYVGLIFFYMFLIPKSLSHVMSNKGGELYLASILCRYLYEGSYFFWFTN